MAINFFLSNRLMRLNLICKRSCWNRNGNRNGNRNKEVLKEVEIKIEIDIEEVETKKEVVEYINR